VRYPFAILLFPLGLLAQPALPPARSVTFPNVSMVVQQVPRMTYLSWFDPNTNGFTGLIMSTNLADLFNPNSPDRTIVFEHAAPDWGLVTLDWTNTTPCAFFRAYDSRTPLIPVASNP